LHYVLAKDIFRAPERIDDLSQTDLSGRQTIWEHCNGRKGHDDTELQEGKPEKTKALHQKRHCLLFVA
jgi:hypothetical protein